MMGSMTVGDHETETLSFDYQNYDELASLKRLTRHGEKARRKEIARLEEAKKRKELTRSTDVQVKTEEG
jgi:hypothetical protein